VKAEYIQHFTITKKEYKDASLEDKENGVVGKPINVQIQTEITKEFWDLETDEFHEQVAKDAEDDHAKQLEEWEQLKEVLKMPQQFHQYGASILYDSTTCLMQTMQATRICWKISSPGCRSYCITDASCSLDMHH
jgi:hypothetical protein